MSSSTNKMSPTFTTRNQSRRKLYTLLLAAIFLILLVTTVVLFKRHKSAEEQNSRINNRSHRGRSRNPLLSPRAEESISSGSTSSDNSIRDKPTLSSSGEPFYKGQVRSSTVVQIPHHGGPIKGHVRRLADGDKVVTSFLGVPYAAPPIDEMRFEAPANGKGWTKIREAFYQPAKCLQGDYLFSSITSNRNDQSRESEDCLYLNIWTPTDSFDSTTAKKPVLVYLHSGLLSFGSIGSTDLDPSNLTVEHDILVVTVQYRLGPFGWGVFESNKSGSELTSLGLQDQAKALEWINSNIGAFGGDAERVTLAGHGAGAISIGAHLMNSKINRYFHRVLIQGLHNIWNIGLYGMAPHASSVFADELGCELTLLTAKSMRKCIKKNKISINSAIDTHHFMMERYAVPFGLELGEMTNEVTRRLKGDGAVVGLNEKPTIEQLKELFGRWNIFPKHIEFMIGLNSDDDYKLETINRNNGEVTFDDDEEDEDEEETDAEARSPSSKKPDATAATDSDQSKSSNEMEIEGEAGDEEEETEMTPKMNITSSTEDNISTMPTTIIEEETTTAVTPTQPTRSFMQRRRRRRRRRRDISSDSKSANITLDSDEVVKLCRLVSLYRQQAATSGSEVSSSIYLYRVDPRVLLSPLEEVNLAFGSRSKHWLNGFDEKLRALWGSFVRMGDFSQINKIGLDYQSHLPSLDSDTVDLINLSQEEDSSSHESTPIDDVAHQHQSELKVSSIGNLGKLCQA